MTSTIERLASYTRVRQINKCMEDNGNQVSDGQRRDVQTRKGRLELEVSRC